MLATSLLEKFIGLDHIIVRNENLAKRYQDTYLRYHKTKLINHPVPSITSLHAFIERILSKQAHSTLGFPQLLSDTQTVCVWSTIISDKNPNPRTAYLAYAAWNFFKQHQINYLDIPYKAQRQWQAWAKRFKYQLGQQKLDFYSMLEAIIQQDGMRERFIPRKIGLVGFDCSTPLEKQFWNYLKQKGGSVQWLSSHSHMNTPTLQTVHFKNADSELTTMAHWAYQTLRDHPDQSIACCIPDFKTQRTRCINTFQRVYREYFKAVSPPNYPFSLPFERIPLSNHPLIQTALAIIYLRFPIPLTTLSPFIRSPYLGNYKQEQFARSQLDRFLRQQNSFLVSEAVFSQYSQTHNHTLANYLKAFQQEHLTSDYLRPSQWVDYFQRQINAWQWAITTPLSDEETYYYAKWLEMLKNFARLDCVLPPIDHHRALKIFTELVSYTAVFLEPTAFGNIKLLDSKDKPYCDADNMWVLNAHQAHSALRTSNPFIPSPLWESMNASLTLYELLTKLSTQEKSVIVSSTQTLCLSTNKILPIKECSPSELITAHTPIENPIHASIQWESFEDHSGPPILNHETLGGSDLIKKQAICPFRAFADYRLSLIKSSLHFPGRTPTKADKATCLHQVLESLWNELKTQECLNRLSNTELEQRLQSSIHQAIQSNSDQKPCLWPSTFITLEKERMYRLLKKWFHVERQRPTFSVKAVEYPIVSNIGPLKLRFTIDRIDQLSDGSLLIIDYKSSAQAPIRQHWMGSRPLEPQLPLYVLSNAAQGIAWVHLHPEYGGKFLGISQGDTHIPTIQSMKQKSSYEWHTLVSKWRTHLEKLAHQFYKGYAAVDPKDGLSSCRYCQYSLLCRIKECQK